MTKQKKRKRKIPYFQGRNVMDSEYKLCDHCGMHLSLNHRGHFCNEHCRELYIEKKYEIIAGTWKSKNKQDKRHVNKLSDILNEDDLKDNNIMNKEKFKSHAIII